MLVGGRQFVSAYWGAMGAAEDCSFGAQPYKPDCKHFNRPLAATQRAKETDMQTDVALGLTFS